MLAKFLFVAVSLTIGSAAIAQNATAPTTTTAPATSAVTASAAKKAHSLLFAGGGSADIFDVEAGPDDSLAAIEIVQDSRAVKIPGNTISAGDKPGRLKTSLTLKSLP
jgi:hypothetical protein